MFPQFFLQGRRLLATYNYDLDAKTVGGTIATFKSGAHHITGASIGGLHADDTLRIKVWTGGAYVAWSPYGIPAYSGPGTGSVYSFNIANPDSNPATYPPYVFSTTLQDGYAAARALGLAAEPWEVTGYEEYWLGIYDDPMADNSGGISLTVEVWGSR